MAACVEDLCMSVVIPPLTRVSASCAVLENITQGVV